MRAGAALLAVLFTVVAWGQPRPSAPGSARPSPSDTGVTAAPQRPDAGMPKGDGGPVKTFPDEVAADGNKKPEDKKPETPKTGILTAVGQSPDDFLKLENQRERLMLRPAVAQAQGALAEVVSEVVLILGEIVVDRATNRAFDLLKDKLELGLACAKPEDSRFRATCEVVLPLRLQELAVTTSALQGAVLQDAMKMGLEKTKLASAGKMSDPDYAFLARVIQANLLPHLTRPHRPLSSVEPSTLIQDLLSFAIGKARTEVGPCSSPPEDEQYASAAVMVTAGAALAACLETSLQSGVDPSNCSVMQVADEFARGCVYLKESPKGPEYTHHARIIAQHLYSAATARVDGKPNGAPDVRVRMGHALDAVFEMACRFARLDAGCDSALDASDDARAIGVLRSVSHAALDRDTNALIGAASRAIAMTDPGQNEKARRGLRIIGGALQYAETYYEPTTAKTEGSARLEATTDSDKEEAAHASRRRILESLTEEMTDRSGRDTDTIFSLGGSLRATAGLRFPSERDAEFEGPLSLPIGLGAQVPLTAKGGHGLHFEAGIVDLGRYVAIRDRTLEKLDAGDALAPSFSAGYYWGQQFPFFVALSTIYQPLFVAAAEPEAEGRPAVPESVGAWSLGLNVGVYVPLFDLN